MRQEVKKEKEVLYPYNYIWWETKEYFKENIQSVGDLITVSVLLNCIKERKIIHY